MSPDALDTFAAQLAQTAPGQVLILAGATVLFLPAPDVDLLAIRLLHHRSILTHSILLPALVLWFAPALGPAAAAGAFLGVAVHLAADLLSPARGYGRIWWPEPVQVSLGRWSRLWILLNALLASWLAVRVLPEAGHLRPVAAGVGVAAAAGYGLLRERSVLSMLVALVVVIAGQGVERWLAQGA